MARRGLVLAARCDCLLIFWGGEEEVAAKGNLEGEKGISRVKLALSSIRGSPWNAAPQALNSSQSIKSCYTLILDKKNNKIAIESKFFFLVRTRKTFVYTTDQLIIQSLS